MARKNSPAANANAQSIVIHSLHRPGAPGLDVAVKPALTNPLTTDHDHRALAGRSADSRTGEPRMSLDRITCFCQSLGLALLARFAGLYTGGRRRRSFPRRSRRCAKVPVKPESLPSVKFVDITKDAGIAFVHYNGALGEKLLPETMGAGVAFLDYDRDGDQDLFFVNSSYWPGHEIKPAPTQALYRNDGKGHFQDVTKEAGLDKTFYGQGVAVGDYDNDNDPDLYVTAIGRGYLFRNDGKGHFEDVTEAGQRQRTSRLAHRGGVRRHRQRRRPRPVHRQLHQMDPRDRQSPGLPAHGNRPCLWPAHLVLRVVLCSLAQRRRAVHRYQRASRASRFAPPTSKCLSASRLGLLLTMSTAMAWSISPSPTTRFRISSFTTRATASLKKSPLSRASPSISQARRGAEWARTGPTFTNDERIGLAIGNFANEMTALYVCDQPSTLQFSDLANLFGLGAPTQPPLKFGLFFFDYDLDGRLDLLSANGHLEPEIARSRPARPTPSPPSSSGTRVRPAKGSLQLVTAENAGPDLFKPVVGRGTAYADIDGDGDLDVVLDRQQRPSPALPQRRRQPEPLAPPRADRKRQDLQPRCAWAPRSSSQSAKRSATASFSRPRATSRQSSFPLTFGLGKADHAERGQDHLALRQGHESERSEGRPVYRIDEDAGLKP